jgi:hypothetical protein
MAWSDIGAGLLDVVKTGAGAFVEIETSKNQAKIPSYPSSTAAGGETSPNPGGFQVNGSAAVIIGVVLVITVIAVINK